MRSSVAVNLTKEDDYEEERGQEEAEKEENKERKKKRKRERKAANPPKSIIKVTPRFE